MPRGAVRSCAGVSGRLSAVVQLCDHIVHAVLKQLQLGVTTLHPDARGALLKPGNDQGEDRRAAGHDQRHGYGIAHPLAAGDTRTYSTARVGPAAGA